MSHWDKSALFPLQDISPLNHPPVMLCEILEVENCRLSRSKKLGLAAG